MVLKEIHSIFTNPHHWKNILYLYPSKWRFVHPIESNVCRLFTENLSHQLSSHLIATEKWKPHPLLKNIPHLYEKNRGFGNPFWWLLVRYLQFIYKNWPSNGICAIGLSEIQWVTIKTSKWGLAPWLKIVPHLIGQKMGKMSPSLHIVYFLFTKIDCCKQKMRPSAHKRSTGILNCPILLFFGVGWGKKPHPIIVVFLVSSVDLIKPLRQEIGWTYR